MTTTTTNITRRDNWPARLALFVEEKRAQPFDWAENNCAFFACDWVAILTGVDPARPWRPEVDSALTAARVLGSLGGIEAIATKTFAEHGWPEAPVAMARRGDLVAMDADGGPALGVCLGAQSVFASPTGLDFRPTLTARRAWRIG